ncbi:MAG TPA: phosphomannomutase/phosphoglucomutase [Propionibacteriaceae bacterium]|nr:phosphomannomutase/phosphoglucomutase [Propionibacteriaceae bacterium]
MITPSIFKANDIRGIVGGDDAEWDVAGARALGRAYVEVSGLQGAEFVLGRDMRVSGPEMAGAFAAGAAEAGAHVIELGLTSTDQLWYASGSRNLPGVQFTASHNPPNYNGVKFCLPGAQPVTPAFLDEVARRGAELDGAPADDGTPAGSITRADTLADYAGYLRSLVDLDGLRPLTVVVDAGNGMAGHTAHAVLDGLGLTIVGLYLDLDGTFPNHQPNPLIPENLLDAQRAVRDQDADLALVFDGDADRCFLIDERGEVVTPSIVTALIARSELGREPGATVVVNSITSHTVAEVVAESGGTTVVSRVGHTYVKAKMAEHRAIFGGEHSAHYYFRDFWGADTGMLAALHVLSLLGHSDLSMSQLVHQFERYHNSGEINFVVDDAAASMRVVAAAFEGRGGADWGDGLTVSGDAAERGPWWFNLRPSNTEPLLRLNVEAKDPDVMAAVRDDVAALVRAGTRRDELPVG